VSWCKFNEFELGDEFPCQVALRRRSIAVHSGGEVEALAGFGPTGAQRSLVISALLDRAHCDIAFSGYPDWNFGQKPKWCTNLIVETHSQQFSGLIGISGGAGFRVLPVARKNCVSMGMG
jgi:hypothetical protein